MKKAPSLYPLLFEPILKPKIWGGNKLATHLGKPATNLCGESWELSGIDGSISVISNGPLAGRTLVQTLTEYRHALVGTAVYAKHGQHFPLLLKFIDANQDLSIQVHPNNEQSNGNGKTEAWYILQANDNACLYSGFNQPVSSELLEKAIQNGTFMEYMNKVPVQSGDFFFIEANQVHTIGKGILLAEIQQPSDITYRLFDFDRTDDQGQKRELHLKEAFEVMRYDTTSGKMEYASDSDAVLVNTPYFDIRKKTLSGSCMIHVNEESFEAWMVMDGEGSIANPTTSAYLKKGTTVVLPAGQSYQLETNHISLLAITL